MLSHHLLSPFGEVVPVILEEDSVILQACVVSALRCSHPEGGWDAAHAARVNLGFRASASLPRKAAHALIKVVGRGRLTPKQAT